MARPRVNAALLLTIAAVDQLAITMSQQGLSVLSVAFKDYSGLGVAQMGTLFAAVALGAVLGMVPAGLALDRLGVKAVAWLAGAAILTVLAILALWLPRNPTALEVLLGLVGVFLPALTLTGMTAVSNRFAGTRRQGRAIGIRQAASPFGGILAASLLPWLVKRWSLSAVLLLVAVNAGGWTMAFGWLLPADSGAVAANLPRGGIGGVRPMLRRLARPLAVSFLLSPGQYALLTYVLLDLHDRWHVPVRLAGPLLAVALVGGFFARIGLGGLVDRTGRTRRWLRATAGVGAGSLGLWAVLPATIPHAFLVAVFLALGAGLDGWNGLLTTWVTALTAESERGISLGLIGMAGFLGIVLFLPLFGHVVHASGSYRPAWLLLAGVYLVGALLIRRSATGA